MEQTDYTNVIADAEELAAKQRRVEAFHDAYLVLLEVLTERQRQNERWGEQNHPDRDLTIAAQGRFGQRMAEEYEIPTGDRARQLCEIAFGRGQGTWAHILVEEVAEAIGTDNAADLRAELVQVAAVAVAWIEAIDRRSA